MKKRSFPLLLILLMVFSSIAQAAPLSAGQAGPASQLNKGLHNYAKSVSKSDVEKSYKKTDKVRVIVEVDGAPAITYATAQGKKYSELSKLVKAQLQNKILDSQKAVKAQFAKKSINMQFKQNFTTAFNGFSGEVEYGQIPEIESIDGVTKVTISKEYQRPVEKPDLKYSKEIVQAQEAWQDYGYKGEGMVIGIIDTGIDPSHRDMVLTDKSKEALTQDKINGLVNDKGLPGKFYTDKVPYGYNYADNNNQILDLGPDATMHGMHVAGIAAANGDENNGGIKGVAPEAQLLALKVFSNDPEMPSTWGDIYIKAIDDAIILGADVINMSLGSSAAFVSPDDPEQQSIKRAMDNGILMSISAGNSGDISYGYTKTPFAANPDTGVVGSPGLSNDSLQVASIENNYMDLNAVTYSFDGTENGKAPFMPAGSEDPTKLTQKYDVVYAGLGRVPGDSTADPNANDFTGLDLTGKFALIKRGESNFVNKVLNAQKAGAVGVIIFNNTDGFINMATDPAIKIPYMFMLKPDGDKLQTALANGTKVSVEFKGDKVTAPNPNAGKMSDFTSWGVTPNLDFKPEITAPGGNILSTLNNNQYGVMSGTSMAAPHVSGGSALVLERVKNDFSTLTGKDKVNMAKNILMNTSKIVEDKGVYNSAYGTKNPYSPRRQGAGVMQLHAALSTPIVVTNTKTNEAKVALKEINGDQATFSLNAENVSDKDVTYNVNGNVQTDLVIKGIEKEEAQGIYKADSEWDPETGAGQYPISFSENQLTIPAHSSKTVDVTIDLKDAVDWYYNSPLDQIFKDGYFVEGFVTLTSADDSNPSISVPYVGFKGDWNKAPILDDMVYDGKVATSFYQVAGVVTHAGKDDQGNDNFDYLGYNPLTDKMESNKIAISPNGDGVNDDVIPYLTFLRNAKTVEYKVVDKDGNVLRKLKSDLDVSKNYYDGGNGVEAYLNPANAWDGKVKNKLVPDGQYYYEIDSTIDYPDKTPQTVRVPVLVDTKAPVVSASVKGDQLTIDGSDGTGSGISYYDILVNGKSVFGDNDLPLAGDATAYTFKQAPAAGSTVEVVAYDNAGNTSEAVVEGANDTTIPYIHVTSVDALGVYNTSDITVAGYVNDQSKMRDFTVNGNPVELVLNADKSQYDFSTHLTLEDGVHNIKISGTDVAGNHIDYQHNVVIIDTKAPQINVDVPTKVKADVTSVDLKATISDNFDQLRYKVDGSEEFYKEFAGLYEMRSYSKEVTTHLTLEPGNNTFTLELEDIAGNKTTKEINIFRSAASHKVNYIWNGQTYYSVDVADGGTVKAPKVPSYPGYTFIGWYKDASFSAKYDFNAPITDDTNVYALVVPNPAAPASPKAASAGYDKVTVSWSKVKGAGGYVVYRSTSKIGTFTKVTTVNSSTSSYTNSGLSTGKTYYYKVQAYTTVNGTKVTGANSAVVGAAPVLSVPTGLKAAKASSTSIKVSWSSVSGASGYDVYRATSKTGSYTKIKSVPSGSYTNTGLTKGKTYYYKVRAYRSVSGTNVYGAYTSVVSFGLSK